MSNPRENDIEAAEVLLSIHGAVRRSRDEMEASDQPGDQGTASPSKQNDELGNPQEGRRVRARYSSPSPKPQITARGRVLSDHAMNDAQRSVTRDTPADAPMVPQTDSEMADADAQTAAAPKAHVNMPRLPQASDRIAKSNPHRVAVPLRIGTPRKTTGRATFHNNAVPKDALPSARADAPDDSQTSPRAARNLPAQAPAAQAYPTPQGQPVQANNDTAMLNMTPRQRLQAYLIRQQLIAGIPPDKMILMKDQHQQTGRNARPPPIIQFTNDSVVAPHIQPAQFNGVLRPLPNDRNITPAVGSPQVGNQEAQHRSNSQRPPPDARSARTEAVRPAAVHEDDRVSEAQRASQQNVVSGNSRSMQAQNRQITHGRSSSEQGRHLNMPETSNMAAARPPSTLSQTRPSRPRDAQRVRPEESLRPRVGNNTTSALPQRSAPIQHPVPSRRLAQPRSLVSPRNLTPPQQHVLPRRTVPLQRPGPPPRPGPFQRVAEAPNPIADRFNLLSALLMYYPHVFRLIASYFSSRDIMNLYTVSKDFMRYAVVYSREFVMAQAVEIAPESSLIFPFRCYRRLCVPNLLKPEWSGLAPKVNWLMMLEFREKTAKDIMRLMEQRGKPLPPRCETVIKKLWFMMDLSDNERRLWTIRRTSLWPDVDIFFAYFLFVSLDLVFQTRFKRLSRLRWLIMAQRNFILLRDVLIGTALETPFERFRETIRWRYNPHPQEANLQLFGIPPQDVGMLQFEGYARRPGAGILQRPDALVLREGVRRNLDMQRYYVDLFLHGNDYVVRNLTPARSWYVEFAMAHCNQRYDWQSRMLVDV